MKVSVPVWMFDTGVINGVDGMTDHAATTESIWLEFGNTNSFTLWIDSGLNLVC